ncbi:MAG: hypothetical protein B7X10_03995 [Burkholderiales bacterium 21-58-4]|nr:MAG: hypothetical protein B7X10_03995 [Burkholderiales bacterium 21-58-4]
MSISILPSLTLQSAIDQSSALSLAAVKPSMPRRQDWARIQVRTAKPPYAHDPRWPLSAPTFNGWQVRMADGRSDRGSAAAIDLESVAAP